MYRETQGNYLILFYRVVAQIFAHQRNPLIFLPEALRNVVIRLMRDGEGRLIIFVTGFPIIARYMLTAAQRANYMSDGTALLAYLQHFGLTEYWQSAAFRERITQVRSQIMNSLTAVLAFFHIDIPQLDLETIQAVPSCTRNRRHLNQEYRRDNFPGLYVGRRRFESSNELLQSRLIRKRDSVIKAFVKGLYESYFQQETPGPVRDTLKGVTVVCKLPGMPS